MSFSEYNIIFKNLEFTRKATVSKMEIVQNRVKQHIDYIPDFDKAIEKQLWGIGYEC